MNRLAGGDRDALAALYDRYGARVFSLALRMVGDESLAEDITHDAFLKIWRAAPTFDPARGKTSSWLLHIAHTTAVDALRARRRTVLRSEEQTSAEHVAEADTAVEAELALLGAEVRSALMRLAPEQREVIELAYFDALSQREIASRLRIPLGTVKSRIRLGLEALRGRLLAPRQKENGGHVSLPSHR